MSGFTRLHGPRDVFALFRRRILLFVAASALTLAAMAAFVMTRVPRYESSALLEVDVHRQSPVGPVAIVPDKGDQGIVGTQMKRMASRTVASHVVDELGLANDVEWSPPPGVVTRLLGSPVAVTQELRRRRAIETLMRRLSIVRDEVAPVVTVMVASVDPARAADIVNAVAAAYLQEASEAGRASASDQAQVLNRQLDRLALEVTQADADLAGYRASHGLTALASLNGGAVDQQASALAGQLAAAQADAAAGRARAAVARSMAGSGRGDAVGEVLQSPVIAQLRQQRETIAAQFAETRIRYGADHPRVARVTEQLAGVDAAIRQEESRIEASVQAAAQASGQREGAIAAALSAVRGRQAIDTNAQVGADRLARIAEAKRTTYVSLAQSAARSVQEGALTSLPGMVIAPGVPAMVASYPQTALLIMLGLLAAPAAGIIAVLGVEAFDTRVRGTRELAVIPGAHHVSSVAQLSARTLGRIDRRAKPWDYVLAKPMSAYAESIRSIRARLALSRNEAGGLVVCVTSAISNEGKSTLSASLARTMALAGDRVLLIDCDLRRNGLAGLLHDKPAAGLAEVLEGGSRFADVLERDVTPGLDVLPLAGTRFTPHDVFGDGRMAGLLERLRGSYDYVIVDAPPVLVVDDAVTIAGLSDAVLLAVRWGSTRIEASLAAVERLREAGIDAIGLVLTAVDPRRTLTSHPDSQHYLAASSGYHRN
ncbi:GumC family protein [Sphingomonas sp. M6A6_1c]